MDSRLIHLRIKIKSLAAEAIIIRAEAKKTAGMQKWQLNHHRTTTVREHARKNLLAYGLLRNIPYEVMEKKCVVCPYFPEIAKIAKRFGGDDETIELWIKQAKKYLMFK